MADTTTTQVIPRVDTIIVQNVSEDVLATIGLRLGTTQVMDLAISSFTYDGKTLTITVPDAAE